MSGEAAAPSAAGGPVRVEGVSVALGGCSILRGIDAEFLPGQVTAIVGPNGAGKTTLLRSILGVVPLAAGRVLIAGRAAASIERRQMARTIALVPQDTHIEFSFTVEDVVRMGRYPHLRPLERERPQDVEALDGALARLDLLPLRRRDVTTLSGGERQRVLVARALATGARIILLDEPVSHLDIGHRLDILDFLAELAAAGYTAVVVLHDLDLAFRCAGRVLVLDRGEKAAEGDPAAILERGVLERVFEVAVARFEAPGGPALAFSRRRGGSGNAAGRGASRPVNEGCGGEPGGPESPPVPGM